MLQLANYGMALMEQLPTTSRSRLLLGVTDLKRIQFLRMTRLGDDGFSYALSPEGDNVLAALCAVLQQEPNEVSISFSVQ